MLKAEQFDELEGGGERQAWPVTFLMSAGLHAAALAFLVHAGMNSSDLALALPPISIEIVQDPGSPQAKEPSDQAKREDQGGVLADSQNQSQARESTPPLQQAAEPAPNEEREVAEVKRPEPVQEIEPILSSKNAPEFYPRAQPKPERLQPKEQAKALEAEQLPMPVEPKILPDSAPQLARKLETPPVQLSKAKITSASQPSQNSTPMRLAALSAGLGDSGNRNAESDPGFGLGSKANPAPKYPRKARKKGWEGRVVLIVEVDEAGHPQTIKVQTSSGYKLLDRKARETVENWVFTPARKDGQAVAGIARVPITFKLTG